MKVIETENVVYYVGRCAKDNDELYNLISPEAIWFHLDDAPSAHVYAVSESKLNRPEIKKAAMLVRQYSKGQGTVIYIPRSKLKLVGQGLVEILGTPRVA